MPDHYTIQQKLDLANDSRRKLKQRNQRLRKKAVALLEWAWVLMAKSGPDGDLKEEYEKFLKGVQTIREGNVEDL